MNENNEKPAAVYLSPLKGELSQLEGISGMELEGIVENIKATIQSEKNKNKGLYSVLLN